MIVDIKIAVAVVVAEVAGVFVAFSVDVDRLMDLAMLDPSFFYIYNKKEGKKKKE